MEFAAWISAVFALLVVLPLVQANVGLDCGAIPAEKCAFAVSDSGRRCVLEKSVAANAVVCQTSDVVAGESAPVAYIETDGCVEACGVDRNTVGFSTDELSSGDFASKICSSFCRSNCANLVDLYSNIIAGDGLTISEFCGEQRRAILIQSRRLITAAVSPV